MQIRNRTYESGEPMDYGLLWVSIGYLVLIALFIISFVGAGYGGALFGIILLGTRLLLLAVILAAPAAALGAWRTRRPDLMVAAIVALPVAVLGLLILSPL